MKNYYFYHATRLNQQKRLLRDKIEVCGCGEFGKGFYMWGKEEEAKAGAREWAKKEDWKEGWTVIEFEVPINVLYDSMLFHKNQSKDDKEFFLDLWFSDVEQDDDEEEEEEEEEELTLAEGVANVNITNAEGVLDDAITNSELKQDCVSGDEPQEVQEQKGEEDADEDDQGEGEYEENELNVLYFETKEADAQAREPQKREQREQAGYQISWNDFVDGNKGAGLKHRDWQFDLIIGPHKGKLPKIKGVPFQYAFNLAIEIINDERVTRSVLATSKGG